MNIIELRQYTVHPGRRDELIELFEREFVESQEALDAHVRAFTPPPSGPPPLATLRTEPAANTYPRLPVREGEHVFVHLTRYPDEHACRAQAPTHVLAPTARSGLR